MQLTLRFPVIRETNAINKKNAAEADDESPECCPLQMVERAPSNSDQWIQLIDW